MTGICEALVTLRMEQNLVVCQQRTKKRYHIGNSYKRTKQTLQKHFHKALHRSAECCVRRLEEITWSAPSCWKSKATVDLVAGSVELSGGCNACLSPAPTENRTCGPPENSEKFLWSCLSCAHCDQSQTTWMSKKLSIACMSQCAMSKANHLRVELGRSPRYFRPVSPAELACFLCIRCRSNPGSSTEGKQKQWEKCNNLRITTSGWLAIFAKNMFFSEATEMRSFTRNVSKQSSFEMRTRHFGANIFECGTSDGSEFVLCRDVSGSSSSSAWCFFTVSCQQKPLICRIGKGNGDFTIPDQCPTTNTKHRRRFSSHWIQQYQVSLFCDRNTSILPTNITPVKCYASAVYNCNSNVFSQFQDRIFLSHNAPGHPPWRRDTRSSVALRRCLSAQRRSKSALGAASTAAIPTAGRTANTHANIWIRPPLIKSTQGPTKQTKCYVPWNESPNKTLTSSKPCVNGQSSQSFWGNLWIILPHLVPAPAKRSNFWL